MIDVEGDDDTGNMVVYESGALFAGHKRTSRISLSNEWNATFNYSESHKENNMVLCTLTTVYIIHTYTHITL